MNSSDISKAVARGIVPGDPRFEPFLERARQERLHSQNHSLIHAQTRGRGFAMTKMFSNASEFVGETKLNCPTWCGHEPKVEKWELGERTLFAFISDSNSQHQSMLFEYYGRSKWRRIV